MNGNGIEHKKVAKISIGLYSRLRMPNGINRCCVTSRYMRTTLRVSFRRTANIPQALTNNGEQILAVCWLKRTHTQSVFGFDINWFITRSRKKRTLPAHKRSAAISEYVVIRTVNSEHERERRANVASCVTQLSHEYLLKTKINRMIHEHTFAFVFFLSRFFLFCVVFVVVVDDFF